MRFDVITLFPAMFQGVLEASILKRAQKEGRLEVYLHDLRKSATDRHKTVDDTTYGGGAGMVLKVDVLEVALEKVLNQPEVAQVPKSKRLVFALTPGGKRLSQARVRYLAEQYQQLTLVCGHYEGFDERFLAYVDECLSMGEYILTGGELPALVVIDAVTRLLPKVIHPESAGEESFDLVSEEGRLLVEYPHYTRPLEYKGQRVPEILLSGNHTEIRRWRLEQAKQKTKQYGETTNESL